MENYNGYFKSETEFATCYYCKEKAFCFQVPESGGYTFKCRRCQVRSDKQKADREAKQKLLEPQLKGLLFMLKRYNISPPTGLCTSPATGVRMPLMCIYTITLYCAAGCLEFTSDFKKLNEIIEICLDTLHRLGYKIDDLRNDEFYAVVKKAATREFYAQRNITSEVPNGL